MDPLGYPPGSKSILGIKIILIIIFSPQFSSAWDPDMPGGMKLIINGETFSFTTELCTGGIFFKQPVHIGLTCLHGYFLRRPNGCTMEESFIIGGQNYACQRFDKDKEQLFQAFIPVTNPDQPLDHTVTLFDEPNTLTNFRRYTYVTGMEGGYEPIEGSTPAGFIVTNSKKTPRIGLEDLCYEGEAQDSGSSFMTSLEKSSDNSTNSSGGAFFKKDNNCDPKMASLTFGKRVNFSFTEGYSGPHFFEEELMATMEDLPERITNENSTHEIWGGLAYCMKANVSSTNGTIKMGGLLPTIESLKPFCGKQKREVEKSPEKELLEELERISRETKKSSPEFDALMTCVSTCWEYNDDKCHRLPPLNPAPGLALCPPYCDGPPPRRVPIMARMFPPHPVLPFPRPPFRPFPPVRPPFGQFLRPPFGPFRPRPPFRPFPPVRPPFGPIRPRPPFGPFPRPPFGQFPRPGPPFRPFPGPRPPFGPFLGLSFPRGGLKRRNALGEPQDLYSSLWGDPLRRLYRSPPLRSFWGPPMGDPWGPSAKSPYWGNELMGPKYILPRSAPLQRYSKFNTPRNSNPNNPHNGLNSNGNPSYRPPNSNNNPYPIAPTWNQKTSGSGSSSDSKTPLNPRPWTNTNVPIRPWLRYNHRKLPPPFTGNANYPVPRQNLAYNARNLLHQMYRKLSLDANEKPQTMASLPLNPLNGQSRDSTSRQSHPTNLDFGRTLAQLAQSFKLQEHSKNPDPSSQPNWNGFLNNAPRAPSIQPQYPQNMHPAATDLIRLASEFLKSGNLRNRPQNMVQGITPHMPRPEPSSFRDHFRGFTRSRRRLWPSRILSPSATTEIQSFKKPMPTWISQQPNSLPGFGPDKAVRDGKGNVYMQISMNA